MPNRRGVCGDTAICEKNKQFIKKYINNSAYYSALQIFDRGSVHCFHLTRLPNNASCFEIECHEFTNVGCQWFGQIVWVSLWLCVTYKHTLLYFDCYPSASLQSISNPSQTRGLHNGSELANPSQTQWNVQPSTRYGHTDTDTQGSNPDLTLLSALQ